jgi:hypothetical protein
VTPEQIAAAQAVAATAAWACGLFFFRFWRDSRDRLFAYFGTAFWLLSLSWMLLAFIGAVPESQPYIYGVRSIAFVLLIVAMIQKNRERQ